jgi:chromosomal replication initiator protein
VDRTVAGIVGDPAARTEPVSEGTSPTASMDPQQLWQVAQEELRFQVVRPGYEAWLANAVLVETDGHTFTVGVPTMFARDWVSERYVPLIRETLSGVLGRDCEVVITVDPEASPPPEAPPHLPDPTYAQVSEPEDGANDSRLNPNFTFSTFVVGNSSRFAHAACRAVAEAPGKAYNPLFLYGGVGLGKTHLMHAIGHAVRETHRQAKVAYVTSEKFMNEMVASIVENRPAEFRMRYRGVDVLLIDDIQFLAGKDHTREEFFHTFNALQEFQKQIVVSSDRPPKDIPTLEDRLRSRFEGGLMADIQPPDFETRLAILTTKLGPYSKLVPDEVCSFIAHRIQKNIRELEGALIRVNAYAYLNQTSVTLDLAEEVLGHLFPTSGAEPVRTDTILHEVAAYFGVSVDDLKSQNRSKPIVSARQIAMYLLRDLTELSLPKIGEVFGGRDHTTVLHAYQKMVTQLSEKRQIYNQIQDLTSRIRNRSGR